MNDQSNLLPVDDDPDYQDEYRELLQKSWDESLRIVIDRVGIPPWSESDNLLNADELRLMSLIDETGSGWLEGGHRIVESPKEDCNSLFPNMPSARYVSPITVAAGFHAEANATAVINSCIDKGYIKRVTTSTESRLMIDTNGRWRLDATQNEETLPNMY